MTLIAVVLYACGGSDPAPAARSTPEPGPGPMLEPDPDPVLLPCPDPCPATFSSSSTIADATVELINLNGLEDNSVVVGSAGSGVAVAAIVRNLPDLVAGELLEKAKAGGIQLRNADGSLIDGGVDESDDTLITTTTNEYRAVLDHGRFGDGTFITRILAGRSANPGSSTDPDIPGISQGVDDLDIYALNYLTEPGRAHTDYDLPVDFLAMQERTTEVLRYVTGTDNQNGTSRRRQIVLFSNPVTPLELLPGLSCENSAGNSIGIGTTGAEAVSALNACVLRGVQAT